MKEHKTSVHNEAFECAEKYLETIAGICVGILPPLAHTQKFIVENKGEE